MRIPICPKRKEKGVRGARERERETDRQTEVGVEEERR